MDIAPGVGRLPISNLSNELCEELASPYLFPEGKFGYKIFRKGQLSSMKYFNQQVLNYTKLFAIDPDFSHLKNVCSGQIIAGVLTQNFIETVKYFSAEDDAYHITSTYLQLRVSQLTRKIY